MQTPYAFWIGFNAGVVLLLFLDLTFLRRDREQPTFRNSIVTTLVWIALAVGFGCWLGWQQGWEHGSQFFAGYVIEYALSVDNLFLFVLIFTGFQIAPAQQRRLLFWGVIGALLMRGVMIGAGVALLQAFSWIIYLFGAYIVYAGVQMLRHKPDAGLRIEENFVVKLTRRFLPLSEGAHQNRFLVRENGRLKFTLLFLVLIIVEVTDLIFALDSIPAIFGVTTDPYVFYTSNVCAVLGLRSLYFVLAGAVKNLVYLRFGLACVLIFIGAKMLGEKVVPVSTLASLLIVGGILGVAVVASLLKTRRARSLNLA